MSATPELEELEDELRQWQGAYPLAMFPEPDLKRAAAVLKDTGMTLDSISASNMRHVVGCIVPKVLPLFDSLRAKDAEIAGLREALERSRELVCNAANTGFAEEECRAIYAHNGKISDVLGDLRARTALKEKAND